MAKNPKKRPKKEYEVGYGKPPKQYRWKKGCPSPNPKGRPKKSKSLKEALQVAFSTEINTKTETGEVRKISCADALAKRTIADALSKDGPTRRMLYRLDILNLQSKEPEMEYDEDEANIVRVEKDYGNFLRQWAELDPRLRDSMYKILSNLLQEYHNQSVTE